MTRPKASGSFPPPRPIPGSLLAGALIGSAVIGIAASAMILGSGMAIQDATRRPWPRRGF
jgi:hypothetical protein